MHIFRLPGSRIIKTGTAVFVTALVCQALGWPPVFAVITAIVTIEPTAAASIQKGLVRFPASIIGAGYAMLFTYLFGHSPLTFTLAAMLTIFTCSKLKLDDGLLVATLSAIAMIEVTEAHFAQAFFTRLGTTSIGLIVSTLVNLFIMPPDYSQEIAKRVGTLHEKTARLFTDSAGALLKEKSAAGFKLAYQSDQHLFTKTETLCRFQREEWRYHRFTAEDRRKVHFYVKKLETLRQIHFHIGNLMILEPEPLFWNSGQKDRIWQSILSLAAFIENPNKELKQPLHQSMQPIMEEFWYAKAEAGSESGEMNRLFSIEISFLYEVLAIFELAEELQSHATFLQKQSSPPLYDYRK
ncbi:FUSC family protein [Bacillus badius]|uniref:aromatic acid exporter family protein n=1 Tax=Bacillus badius TaxID=1455 RepID=UPI001CBEEDE9|nr:aromatic acid exporter family protein [Bacillus badius]UAT31636.1 FUSC family protein [Bacillus badius]